MNEKGLKVGGMIVEDKTEILGVNDRAQLEMLTRLLRIRINAGHMANRCYNRRYKQYLYL